MLEFQPFNEFCGMLLSERVESAANALVRAVGQDAVRRATEALQEQGLISDDCAAHIVLGLMSELSLGQEQVQRMERLGLGVPEELAEERPALAALFGETAIAVEIEVEDEHRQAREDRLHALEQLRAAKGRADGKNGKAKAKPEKSQADDGEQRTCPVCGEPISAGAAGCRRHWRQVKKMQDEFWTDSRAPSDG